MIKKTLLIFSCLSGTILLFFLNKATLCRSQPDNWIKVLTPSNQASVLYENIHFVVQTEDLDMANIKLKVTHNNLFLKKISPHPGYSYFGKHYFHFSVNLHIGPNKINLRFINKIGEVLDEKDLDLSYGNIADVSTIINIGNPAIIWYLTPQKSSLSEPDVYKFHIIEQKWVCLKCHDFNISDPEVINSEKISCFQCHREISNNKNTHQSIMDSFNCLECHRQDQKMGYGFKQITSELCISCHKKDGFTTRKYLHAPLTYGECWTCHKPHKGKLKYRLRKKVNKLCTSCHAGKHYGGVKINNHPILYKIDSSGFEGKQYECTDCHDPHSSNVNKFLLLSDTKGPNAPCKKCHSQYF